MKKRPQYVEGRCDCVEKGVADIRKWVVLQLKGGGRANYLSWKKCSSF
jgi:hypothetical protein